MPIRGLESFKKQFNQTVYSKVSANILNETVVGIDGYWFLRKYTQIVNVHDIFLKENKERYLDPVLKFIKMAKDCNFEILWVWDGISYKKPQIHQTQFDLNQTVTEGYKYYSKGDYSNSNRIWRSLVDQVSILEDINNMLKTFEIPVMTAPFSASTQLAYFLSQNICGYVFGKNDILIYENIDKVIVDIFFDIKNGFSVELINKKSICERLEIDYNEFKPLAFALGCEFCPTLPEYAKEFILENIVTIIKTEGIESYLNKSKDIESYIKMFYNAYILTDYQPVMKEKGIVCPYNENSVPTDIEQFFGKKLPDVLYEQMFLNKISSEVLSTLAFESFSETDPDCIDLANITYAILKNKININVSFDGGIALDKKVEICDRPNKINFYNIVAPGIHFDLELPIVPQILLSKNVKYHMFDCPISNKILIYKPDSYCNNELQFDESILKFYLKNIRLRNLLKQCKEAYELVTGTEIGVQFKERFNLNASCYYEKFKDHKNDPTIIKCSDFINKVYKFLVNNYGQVDSVKEMINEINLS